MSGHSKWAQIKHRKAGTDAKRGILFSKFSRLISIAARDGGPNIDANTKLRQAVEQARSYGLPKDTIERAIERASESREASSLQDVEYEAYGPGGIALIMNGLTDNTNRTTNEVKHILSEHGGRLAESGSVNWLFEKKLVATFPVQGNRDELELSIIDAGADDTSEDGASILAMIPNERAREFLEHMRKSGREPTAMEQTVIPKNTVNLSEDDAKKAKDLIDALESHPDISNVSANMQER